MVGFLLKTTADEVFTTTLSEPGKTRGQHLFLWPAGTLSVL